MKGSVGATIIQGHSSRPRLSGFRFRRVFGTLNSSKLLRIYCMDETPKRPHRTPPNAGKGRRKGVPNKATREVREFCQRLLESEDYQAALRQRISKGRLAPALECLIWTYAYGKPKERVEMESEITYKWLDRTA